MANHKSAKKRSRQNTKRNEINSQVLSKLKTNLNKFIERLKNKNTEDIDKTLISINSSIPCFESLLISYLLFIL